MMLFASILLCLAPQGVIRGKPDRLVLPKKQAKAEDPQDQQAPRDRLQELFHKDALELRRSQHLPASKEMALIRRIGETYDRIPERALALARLSDPDLTHGLMRILRAFGRGEDASELKFLLLTRPFGSASEVVVSTMATLAQDDAADLLFDCVTASRSAVRKYVAEELDPRVRPEHVERLITLSTNERADIAVKALRLLGRVPGSTDARARLLRALEEQPLFAEAGCRALIAHGDAAVPSLIAILSRPASGRTFAYATIALAGIESARGTDAEPLFTDDMAPHLAQELTMPDPFQRSAVAIGLAGLAYRSGETAGELYHDREVIEALIAVVAPSEYIPHLSLMEDFALRRLTLLSGRDFGLRHGRWRDWWEATKGLPRYVGSRLRVDVDATNAGSAILRWHGRRHVYRFRGENIESVSPIEGALEIMLTGAELAALIDDVKALGFMGPGRIVPGQPDGRRLVLNVGGAVCQTDPELVRGALDRFGARIERAATEQRWQLYRDEQLEPDFAAFWRAERRWLERHPDADERADRLKHRIVSMVGKLPPPRVDLALLHLAEIPGLTGRITDADGMALIDAVRAMKTWDDRTFKFMELALLAPGDAVCRNLLDVAEERAQTADGRQALARIFALLGPDRILESIGPETNVTIRVCAMDEVSRLRDLRAVPALVAAAHEDDLRIQRTAVYTLGKLGSKDAEPQLLELLSNDDLDPGLRRTTWIALARMGGESVFEVLQHAFPSPDPADRSAIVQALGELRLPAASRELANIYALRGNETLGLLALEHLKRHGDLLASPALEPHLEHQNLEVRRQVILTLASFQNPASLPGLLTLLTDERDRARVPSLIAGITGQDLTGRNDRIEFLRAWYGRNGGLSQAAWFLQALTEQGIRTTLTTEQIEHTETAAIPELTRLMVDAEPPYLRSLAARLLRQTTGKDFGNVLASTSEDQRRAIAERYSMLYDADKAASKR